MIELMLLPVLPCDFDVSADLCSLDRSWHRESEVTLEFRSATRSTAVSCAVNVVQVNASDIQCTVPITRTSMLIVNTKHATKCVQA